MTFFIGVPLIYLYTIIINQKIIIEHRIVVLEALIIVIFKLKIIILLSTSVTSFHFYRPFLCFMVLYLCFWTNFQVDKLFKST